MISINKSGHDYKFRETISLIITLNYPKINPIMRVFRSVSTTVK